MYLVNKCYTYTHFTKAKISPMTHVCIQTKMTYNTLKRPIENSKSPLNCFCSQNSFLHRHSNVSILQHSEDNIYVSNWLQIVSSTININSIISIIGFPLSKRIAFALTQYLFLAWEDDLRVKFIGLGFNYDRPQSSNWG